MLHNALDAPVAFELALEFANDFADIFTVKNHDFALGDPSAQLPPPAEAHFDEPRTSSCSRTTRGGADAGDPLAGGPRRAGKIRYWVELEPRAAWDIDVEVVPSLDGEADQAASGQAALRRGAGARRGLALRLAAARPAAPRLLGRPLPLVHAARSPTSPRSASTAAKGSATCRRRECRGS